VEYELPFSALSNFQCALATRVFERMGAHQTPRNESAAFYRRHLGGVPHVTPVEQLERTDRTQFIRYPVLVGAGLRGQVKQALKDSGIEDRDIYSGPDIDEKRCPNAEQV